MSTFYDSLPTVDRPCPAWCDLAPGHGWDSYDEAGRELRGHGRDLSAHASLWVEEYADEPGVTRPAGLMVAVDEVKNRTAAEVRQLAAELLNAADALDDITGA